MKSFNCDRCGSCCKRVGDLVKLVPDLWPVFQPKADGSCRFLKHDDDGRYSCREYDRRPDICRVDKLAEFINKATGISKKEVYDYNKKMCLTLRAGKEA